MIVWLCLPVIHPLEYCAVVLGLACRVKPLPPEAESGQGRDVQQGPWGGAWGTAGSQPC